MVDRLIRLIIETGTLTGDIPPFFFCFTIKTLTGEGGYYYLLLQPPSQSSIWSCSYSQAILPTGKPQLEFLEKYTLI